MTCAVWSGRPWWSVITARSGARQFVPGTTYVYQNMKSSGVTPQRKGKSEPHGGFMLALPWDAMMSVLEYLLWCVWQVARTTRLSSTLSIDRASP